MKFFNSALYQRVTNISFAFILAVSTLTAMGPFLFSSSVSALPAPGVFSVSGDTSLGENSEGWLFNRDTNNATPIEFNADEASVGSGSLYVEQLSSSVGARKFIGEYFISTEIADINAISYDYKIGAGGDASDANEFYMNVYANYAGTSPTKYYDCKYDVVPSLDATGSFQTMTFDPSQDYQVTRGTQSWNMTTQPTCPDSPSEMGDGSFIRMFALNLGDTTLNDANLDGYFDNVVIDSIAGLTTYDFEPDTQRPSVSFVNPAIANQAFRGDAAISFEATDNDQLSSMVVNIKDEFNSAHLGSCGSVSSLTTASHTLNCTIDTTDFVDGTYFLRAGATDVSGNNKTISRSVVFDNTKPSAQITSPLNSALLASSFAVEGVASDATTDISEVLYTVTNIDAIGGDYVSTAASGTANGTTDFDFNVSGLSTGFYRVKVQAFDGAGNWRYDHHDVEVDANAPVITDPTLEINGVEADFAKSGDTAKISVTITDVPSNSIDKVQLWVRDSVNTGNELSPVGGAWMTPGDAVNSYEYEFVLPAAYNNANAINESDEGNYYNLRAYDTAGNQTWLGSQRFTIDNTDPVLKVNLDRASYLANGGVTGPEQNPEIEASDANLDRIEVSKDGTVTNTWIASSDSRRAKISFLGEGAYILRAYDKAGNVSDTFEVTIDKTNPVATILSPSDAAFLNGSVDIRGSVSDENLWRYYFVIKDSDGTTVFDKTVNTGEFSDELLYTWDTTAVEDGEYTVFISARDLADNKDGDQTTDGVSTDKITVTVDNTAPVVTINALEPVIIGDNAVFTGTMDDPTAVLTFILDGIEYPTTNDGTTWQAIVPTSGFDAGDYVAVISAEDAVGNSSEADTSTQTTLTVEEPAPAPEEEIEGTDTTPETTPLTTGGTPQIAAPAVLGDTTDTDDGTTNQDEDDAEVEGATTEGTFAQADTDTTDGTFLGLAWYWWLLIVGGLAALIGWLIAAARRRSEES